ncbi:hypothetical protein BY996DRAFT_6489078 [Phakopsora pachyrhizi]|nr:hypothetical protein BY996DRAFT_6489078 [Phakopsora pachyrhizi]
MSSWIPSFSQQEEDDTPPSETGQQQQLQQQYYQGSPSSPQPQPSSYRHNHQNLINLTNKTTLQPDHHKKSDTSGHQTQSAKNQIDQTHQHYQHHSDQTTENSSNTEPLEPSTSVLVRNHLINPKSTLNNTQGQLPNHHHHHHQHQPSIPPEPITINTSYLRDHQQLNQHSLIRSNSSSSNLTMPHPPLILKHPSSVILN